MCPRPSISLPPAFLPSVVFNCYHYVSAEWNPLGIHFFSYHLQASLFFSAWHCDCNGWKGESSSLLSCLSFSHCLQPEPWQCCFWLARGENGHFDIFTPWNVAAHGITCKHCSLLPWQLMTNTQPSCTCLRRERTQTGPSHFALLGAIKAERPCSLLFSRLVLFCLPVLTFNHVIKCTLSLSCLHRSDCILNSGLHWCWETWDCGGKAFDDRLSFFLEQREWPK